MVTMVTTAMHFTAAGKAGPLGQASQRGMSSVHCWTAAESASATTSKPVRSTPEIDGT
jgi:hypothetical protein